MDEKLLHGLTAEMERLDGKSFTITLDYLTAYCVIAALQMALSHPEVDPFAESTDRVKEFATALQTEFDFTHFCKSTIQKGWEPR